MKLYEKPFPKQAQSRNPPSRTGEGRLPNNFTTSQNIPIDKPFKSVSTALIIILTVFSRFLAKFFVFSVPQNGNRYCCIG